MYAGRSLFNEQHLARRTLKGLISSPVCNIAKQTWLLMNHLRSIIFEFSARCDADAARWLMTSLFPRRWIASFVSSRRFRRHCHRHCDLKRAIEKYIPRVTEVSYGVECVVCMSRQFTGVSFVLLLHFFWFLSMEVLPSLEIVYLM